MFSGSSKSMELVGILYDLTGNGKSKMAASKLELYRYADLEAIILDLLGGY